LKQATYILEKNPEAQVYIFYIDIRALGRYEDFFNRVKGMQNLHLIKGKVGQITEDAATGNLTLVAEDQETQRLLNETFEMVVLATGMVPTTRTQPPANLTCDENGFVISAVPGVYGAGCVNKPYDVASSVQDATAAAMKAIQSTVGR
jgi:quinone-modifying oxidoreductase subunit QmoA